MLKIFPHALHDLGLVLFYTSGHISNRCIRDRTHNLTFNMLPNKRLPHRVEMEISSTNKYVTI